MDELKETGTPESGETLYVLYRDDDPVGYAYGEPWVAQALMMDDWRYDTEEAAVEAWRRWKETHRERSGNTR